MLLEQPPAALEHANLEAELQKLHDELIVEMQAQARDIARLKQGIHGPKRFTDGDIEREQLKSIAKNMQEHHARLARLEGTTQSEEESAKRLTERYAFRMRELERNARLQEQPEVIRSGAYTAQLTLTIPTLAWSEFVFSSLVNQHIHALRIQVVSCREPAHRALTSLQSVEVGHRFFLGNDSGLPDHKSPGIDLSHPHGMVWVFPPDVSWSYSERVKVRVLNRAGASVDVSVSALGREGTQR